MSNPTLTAIKQLPPGISITWQVNDWCNYRCGYCNKGNWAGNNKNDSDQKFQTILLNLEHIISFYEKQNYNAFKFFFSGGEPTFWNHLIPLISWLKNRLDDPHIAVNTNLSQSISWWQSNYHFFHDVVASFHPEFTKKQKFFETAEFLQDKVNYLCCRMMMDENHFLKMTNIGDELKNLLMNYNIEWVPLLENISVDAKPWDYSQDWMKQFFQNNNFESQTKLDKPKSSRHQLVSYAYYDNGSFEPVNSNRIIADRQNFFQGWKCWTQEGLFIDNRGNIRAASCGVGADCGNIFDKVKLQAEPVVCNKYHCTCGTDIIISKEKQHV